MPMTRGFLSSDAQMVRGSLSMPEMKMGNEIVLTTSWLSASISTRASGSVWNAQYEPSSQSSTNHGDGMSAESLTAPVSGSMNAIRGRSSEANSSGDGSGDGETAAAELGLGLGAAVPPKAPDKPTAATTTASRPTPAAAR